MKKAKKFWYGSFLPNGDTGRFKKKITPKPHSGIRMREVLVPVVHRFFSQEEDQASGWIYHDSDAGRWINKICIDGKFVSGVVSIHRKKRKIVVCDNPPKPDKHRKKIRTRIVHARYMMKILYWGGRGGVSIFEHLKAKP